MKEYEGKSIAYKNYILATERALGRSISFLVKVRSSLFALVGTSIEFDNVKEDDRNLLQLPKLFARGDADDLPVELMYRSEIQPYFEDVLAMRLNVYLIYKLSWPRTRSAVPFLAVKRPSEDVSQMQIFRLEDAKRQQGIATVALGKPLRIPSSKISYYESESFEAALCNFDERARYKPSVRVYARTLEQVGNR